MSEILLGLEPTIDRTQEENGSGEGEENADDKDGRGCNDRKSSTGTTNSSQSSKKTTPLKRRPGARGDDRMRRAIQARINDPHLPLEEALLFGGFRFQNTASETKNDDQLDEDGISLKQRKNQLNRRLRIMKEKEGSTEKGRLPDRLGGKWGDKLNELRLYKMEHGDTNVPIKYAPNLSLANWVHKQRTEYDKMQQGKPSQMTAKRVAALDDIEFTWKVNNARWKERLEELRKYKKQHGDVNVPQGYHANLSLGLWVRNQRQEYQRMQEEKPSGITAGRVAALEELGFVWKMRDARRLEYAEI